jgi:hypothetical protein
MRRFSRLSSALRSGKVTGLGLGSEQHLALKCPKLREVLSRYPIKNGSAYTRQVNSHESAVLLALHFTHQPPLGGALDQPDYGVVAAL